MKSAEPCPHCGSLVQDDIDPDIYCGECGESLLDEPGDED